jgi:hypothetical protein
VAGRLRDCVIAERARRTIANDEGTLDAALLPSRE